jgi:hypothetical protein
MAMAMVFQPNFSSKALFLNAVFAVFRSISLQHFGAAFCNDSLNDQNDPKNAAAKCCSQILQKLEIFEPPPGVVSAVFRCSISLQHFLRSPPGASTIHMPPLSHFPHSPSLHTSLATLTSPYLFSLHKSHIVHTQPLHVPALSFLICHEPSL